ncbi:hypothetical protein PtA15_2A44 [Puccinia triticina]|uniref:Response regulatory domain-containing protein n=1 Tax=Puccinia triticina TaxID=208348 RepID=A0ABY7CBH1_9BASI|nr:uncharacterized protein PtA15_2A44 [Puccinia triticina]WAQ81733.1 hypothetical protein PtA15_2A44 [Puccinia triticina]WAR52620.1 hypothetical protein PtB15_2B44 [Puccinia triticina]
MDPTLARLNVLIVDDNHLNLRVMKQLLKTKLSAFLHLDALQTADSGLQALELLHSNHFDLLFLDISMPGISGLEVCRRLRNNPSHPSSNIHICAVTTDLADWQVQLYKSLGMHGVIGKPLKNHDLEFALKASAPSNPSSPSTNDHRKFRQQSVVSDTSLVAGVLVHEEPASSTFLRIPRPCFDQLDLIDEALISDYRPSFDSFDTCSTSGSVITCSSLGPNSATTIEPLSPSYCSEHPPFEHSSHKRFPAFPTAPILTSTHVPSGLRSPRRWSSPLYSLGSPSADSLLAREENDVFAAGFQAALNHMSSDQACTRWGEDCLSAATAPPTTHDESAYDDLDSHEHTITTTNLASWIASEEEGERKERAAAAAEEDNMYRWARLAGPIGCDDAPKLSSVTRQLISRRSHPMLRLDHLDHSRTSSSAEPSPTELRVAPDPDSPFMRKSKSAAGLPIRPSWQLVQLSAINYQSILKSGNLLDEVLVGLDLEDTP